MGKSKVIMKTRDIFELNKRNLKAYLKKPVRPKSEKIVTNSIQWVGHATTIINMEGKIILTDPVTKHLGYMKRLVKPSVNLKNLKIDYILITHGHMDHLDYSVLAGLDKNATVITSRGVKKTLKIIGFKKVNVLSENEAYKDRNIEIDAIKANHNGKRYYFFGYKDSNSYLIKGNKKSVLFAGDTAYTTVYKDIKVDAAIMPVGCYKPDEFLKMHCSPEQAFKMFKMMRAKQMIPIHYKTYILAQDDDNETLKRLNTINDGSIKIVDVGQTIVF